MGSLRKLRTLVQAFKSKKNIPAEYTASCLTAVDVLLSEGVTATDEELEAARGMIMMNLFAIGHGKCCGVAFARATRTGAASSVEYERTLTLPSAIYVMAAGGVALDAATMAMLSDSQIKSMVVYMAEKGRVTDTLTCLLATPAGRDGLADHQAITRSVIAGSLDVLRMLLQAAPKPLSVDGFRMAMRSAVKNNRLDMFRLMVEYGAAARESDDGLLQYSANVGNVGAVELCLAAGSDPDANNGNCLRCAVFKGYTDMARVLVAAGADVSRTVEGCTSHLVLAASHGDADMVQFLLEAGVRKDEPELVDAAVKGASVRVINCLIAAGVSVRVLCMELERIDK